MLIAGAFGAATLPVDVRPQATSECDHVSAIAYLFCRQPRQYKFHERGCINIHGSHFHTGTSWELLFHDLDHQETNRG